MWSCLYFYLFFVAFMPIAIYAHEHRDNDAHSFYEEQSPIYKDQYLQEGSHLGCAKCTKEGLCDECKQSRSRHNRIKIWR